MKQSNTNYCIQSSSYRIVKLGEKRGFTKSTRLKRAVEKKQCQVAGYDYARSTISLPATTRSEHV